MNKNPRIDLPFVERTLKRMISIPSVLPNEEALAEFIAGELRAIGIEPEWHEVAPGRPNVYGSAELGDTGRFLVFSGHSDTVDVASGWETNPFEPVSKDGRLYGLGAINMKSGLACALGAFKAIVECSGLSGRLGRLGMAVCVDQEGYSAGARALLGTAYGRCDAMLHAEHFFGDSPENYLPLAVTGKVLYKLTVRGRSAHACRPHEGGVNAVSDASRIITALDQLTLRQHPVLGRGTVCVLKIEGGSQTYSMVVPERCEAVITRLTVPGETRSTAAEDMRELIERLSLESQVDIEMAPPSYEPYFLDEKEPIVTAFKEAYRRVTGGLPYFAPHRGVVDANVFSGEGGIPNVVFGPKGGNHHKAGEYVELDTLEKVTATYVETALRFLSGEAAGY